MRVSPAAYLALPLSAHSLLADVPLHDVSAVDLPGTEPDLTIPDLWRLMESRDRRFRVLYVLDREAAQGIRNAAVHGFLVYALADTPEGTACTGASTSSPSRGSRRSTWR